MLPVPYMQKGTSAGQAKMNLLKNMQVGWVPGVEIYLECSALELVGSSAWVTVTWGQGGASKDRPFEEHAGGLDAWGER